MHVQCCENCEDWEPIPFHRDGGLCLRSGRQARQKAAANLIRGTTRDTHAHTQHLIGLR